MLKRYAGKFKKVSCAECGTVLPAHSLEVHHIDGDHENNDLNNLKILCTICHRKHHFKRHEDALIKNGDEREPPKVNWQGRLKPEIFYRQSIRAMSPLEQEIARILKDAGWIEIVDGDRKTPGGNDVR